MGSFFDRLAVRLRPIFFWSLLVSAPVYFIAMLKMLELAYYAWPTWVFITTVVSHAITFLALAMFQDVQQERSNRPKN